MDYGDVIYDQPNNDSFSDKIEQLQNKACLAITGAIQRTSRECLYNELGLENFSSRRWCRKLCGNCKLLSIQCPKYLFSHLNEHKFRHDFLDSWNPLCNCSLEVEQNEHFFLRCLNFEHARRSLFIDISSINSSFKNLPSHLKVELLLYGDSKLSAIDNNLILKASIKYIITTNRFSVPLF